MYRTQKKYDEKPPSTATVLQVICCLEGRMYYYGKGNAHQRRFPIRTEEEIMFGNGMPSIEELQDAIDLYEWLNGKKIDSIILNNEINWRKENPEECEKFLANLKNQSNKD